MKELVRRLLFLLIAILVYRFGVHVPVPGIQPAQLANLFKDSGSTFLGLFDLFSGGALRNFSIFALGIVPYISASIIMQLMQGMIPSLKQLRREGDKGRRKVVSYTRFLTLALALAQGFGLSFTMKTQNVFYADQAALLMILAATSIAAGSMFLVWLGEEITERGVGNGMSMLIFVSIASGLPSKVVAALEQVSQGGSNILTYLLIVVILILMCMAIIWIERAQRRIPITYASRNPMQSTAGNGSYFPLKINMSGVVPAIFASSVLLLPYSLAQWMGSSAAPWLQQVALLLSPGQLLYGIVFVVAVFFFSFFYVSLVFNPSEVADGLMKRSNGFIPGIRPGRPTADFFKQTVSRLTLIGAAYIATISLAPQIISSVTGAQFLFAGTSVLITIVVAMDFRDQVQTHLFSAQYASVLSRSKSKQSHH